jgi:hypothetical protein
MVNEMTLRSSLHGTETTRGPALLDEHLCVKTQFSLPQSSTFAFAVTAQMRRAIACAYARRAA